MTTLLVLLSLPKPTRIRQFTDVSNLISARVLFPGASQGVDRPETLRLQLGFDISGCPFILLVYTYKQQKYIRNTTFTIEWRIERTKTAL